MNLTDYERISAELDSEAKGIETAKRPGYTGGDEDVLRNFKSVADRLYVVCPCGCGHRFHPPPGLVLAVYFLKHVDAVLNALTQPDLPQAEAPLGRFSDARNYLHLGWAIYSEAQDETPQTGA